MFKPVDPKQSLPKMEEDVLKFWEENKIFEKSLEQRLDAPLYSFYDGPPFATGTPHYGHIVASTMKDVVPRYWTMRGFNVPRKWGWDCHGLPIENIAEKELGVKRKKEILEKYGVEKFNEICRSKVLEYTADWKKVIRRLGRWADMENAYKTMDLPFMESVWWVFKQLWDKGLIYEGYRSMHICPRCETTLSQSEVAEGYKMVKDLSATVKFHLKPGQKWAEGQYETKDSVYVLAWTTTPWTLIGNVALAVGENIEYTALRVDGIKELLIIASDRVDEVFKEREIEIVHNDIKGKDLVGLEYDSIFDYYSKDEKLQNSENGWKIYPGDFVTTEEGTGIVHIAPAFGEDDMNLGKKYNLPFVSHVDMDGTIRSEAKDFAGLDVKPIDDSQKTDVEIIKYLAKKNLLFAKKQFEHSYPHCWRCDTPLLNYATSSWFVSVEKIKEKMLDQAKDINWSPGHIKEGRFGNWLEGARDWSISRQRFWASVIPIWKCEKCAEIKVVGSVDEIREQFGNPNKLFLVRHGEAENNVKRIILSHPKEGENPLTEKGQKQIEELAGYLEDKRIDVIFSSPIQRTVETAEIISKKTGAEIIIDAKLTEVECGKLEGTDWDSFIKLYPQMLNPDRTDSNGMEGLEDIRDRLVSFIDGLNKKYKGKNIVIISHGNPLRVMKGILLSMKKEETLNESMHKKGQVVELYSKPVDLHKHVVDKITFKCEKCDGEMKRIPDVLDTWFDSGSMPYAQAHYPFENKENFEKSFPADFIAEGVDQTRAWFYYLHAISTAIKDSNAYKNVIVNGIVVGEDGKKLSKRLKNYPDPSEMMEKYGADALRYYLMDSPVVAAENLTFSEKDMSENVRGMFRMLWNTYSFFVLYANIDKYQASNIKYQVSENANLLDRWIVSELSSLIKNVNQHMESYELNKTARLFPVFIDNLSNWYVRRSRKRFWKSENDGDKNQAYETLHYVLIELSKLMAPFTPFVAEEIYKNLTNSESVHLADFPAADEKLIDDDLNEKMQLTRRFVKMGLAARARVGIKVRQPLAELKINEDVGGEMAELIKEEVNVKKVSFAGGITEEPGFVREEEISWEAGLDTKITDELRLEGEARELVRRIQELRKKAGYQVDNRITLCYQGGNEIFEKFGDLIAKETLAEELSEGEDVEANISELVELETTPVKVWLKKIEEIK
ncbi:MAG: class I tRNA ligase family protein [Parcubacteria group bacterium]|jgi:isoleucyl-tRNA synthetase